MTGVAIEVIGMVSTKEASEIKGSRDDGSAVDSEYLTRFARAHEASGFDRVLIGYGATHVDGWAVAAHVLHETGTLKVLVAHRPGFTQPTIVGRRAATLDNLSGGGRVGIHFITGGDETDQNRDGDFLAHDDRYRRTAEYMSVVRATINSSEPFDHEGEFYRYEGAWSVVHPVAGASVPLYFGGASGPALEAGAANADVYMLWGEPLAGIAERISQIREVASRYGREPSFSLSTRPILADTEAEAWDRAHSIAEVLEGRLGSRAWGGNRNNTSVGGARLRAFAEQGEVLDERLWTKVAALTGGGYNATALVGTAEQVAESLLRYYDLGVTRFLIRGFDPFEDAVDYGKALIPALRAGAESRASAVVAALR
jgi:alkanesulfonate monooxygenase